MLSSLNFPCFCWRVLWGLVVCYFGLIHLSFSCQKASVNVPCCFLHVCALGCGFFLLFLLDLLLGAYSCLLFWDHISLVSLKMSISLFFACPGIRLWLVSRIVVLADTRGVNTYVCYFYLIYVRLSIAVLEATWKVSTYVCYLCLICVLLISPAYFSPAYFSEISRKNKPEKISEFKSVRSRREKLRDKQVRESKKIRSQRRRSVVEKQQSRKQVNQCRTT